MLIWSRKGRAAAGALAVTLFAGVFLLPLAVILLSSLVNNGTACCPPALPLPTLLTPFAARRGIRCFRA